MQPFILKHYLKNFSSLVILCSLLIFFGEKFSLADSKEEAYYYFLLSQIVAKDSAEAEAYLQKAVKLERKSLYLKKVLMAYYLENKKLEEARDLGENLYKKNPYDKEIVWLLSRVYLQENRPNRAIMILEKYLEKEPKDQEILSFLISLFLQQREWDQALLKLDQLEKMHPQNYAIFLFKARIYREKEDYKAAEKAYLKAIELSPDNKPLILEALQFFESISDKEEIEKILIDYLVKNPEDKDFLRLLLGFYLEQKDFEKSENLLKSYLEKHKDQPEFLFYLGLILEYKDKNNEALKIYKEIPPGSPWYIEAQRRIFEILKRKNLEEAKTYLKELRKVDYKEKSFFVFLSNAYESVDLCEKGAEIAKTGLINYPEDPDLILALASNYACLENYEEVLKIVEPLMKRFPEDAYVLNFVGYSLVELNRDLDRAENLLLKANELKPEDPYILDSLGWLYYKKGDYEKARTYLEKAVEKLKVDEPEIWAHLGEIYLKLGNKEKACELFKKAHQKTIHQREKKNLEKLLKYCP
jgi:predicted Zn-dependent protease